VLFGGEGIQPDLLEEQVGVFDEDAAATGMPAALTFRTKRSAWAKAVNCPDLISLVTCSCLIAA
jgi:hypothetical protein